MLYVIYDPFLYMQCKVVTDALTIWKELPYSLSVTHIGFVNQLGC